MKKIRKILVIFVTLVSVVIATIPLIGCGSLEIVYAWYENSSEYDNLPTVMNAGESITITRAHFEHVTFEFEDFEVWVHSENGIRIEGHSSVMIVNNNTITAGDSGRVILAATLTQPREGNVVRKRHIFLAEIYVINEDTMIHITTAEELQAINDNLDGHFILMNDIDLSGIEWTPIGRLLSYSQREPNQSSLAYAFTGMFVNPQGYVISNLTITTGFTNDIGLFGFTWGAFIYGVILNSVDINASDFIGIWFMAPDVGGLVGFSAGYTIIMNTLVSGTIIGGGQRTGGIAGSIENSFIIGARFEGKISIISNATSHRVSIGGIIGANYFIRDSRSRFRPNIINVHAYADLCGGEWADVGGIVGHTRNRHSIGSATFTGNLFGRSVGTKIGHNVFSNGPVNFD